MPKRRKIAPVLCALLGVLALALLLSALVEAPAEPQAAQAPAPVAAAQLMPAVPQTPETAPGGRLTGDTLRLAAFILPVLCALPCLLRGTDANGRVLRRRRYARCFYPVFRQELACG